MSMSHQIKPELNSEGKKSDPPKVEKIQPGQKEKPNFRLSGKFIKYSEPPEARKPKIRWRLYPFKGNKCFPPLYIHKQSSYLIGRDRKVADIPEDTPSYTKHHAALQYRLIPFKHVDGTSDYIVKPYIIDLKSKNGTILNNRKIEPWTYVELLEKDVIKFGYSSREYVLMHEEITG
jgi:smad nuclear-interacting protein 1